MIKKLFVSVDVSNLYYCANKKFGSRLDYAKYLEFCQDYGAIFRAVAYGAQLDGEADGFIKILRQQGYEPKYKCPRVIQLPNDKEFRKADWDVGMAMDIVRVLDAVDGIILGSADSDMIPVVEYVQSKGKVVIVIACNIAKDLKMIANEWYEVGDELMIGGSRESSESVVMPANGSSHDHGNPS
jgi:uncharacterized LabA/DUF88 family protein